MTDGDGWFNRNHQTDPNFQIQLVRPCQSQSNTKQHPVIGKIYINIDMILWLTVMTFI